MSETNKPVYRLKYGYVVATVWVDNSSCGYFYHTTIKKIAPLPGGGWGDYSSFDDRDLPNLAKAAADAHTWIYQQKAQAATVSGSDEAEWPEVKSATAS